MRDIDSLEQQDRVARLDRALLVLHAPSDEIVGIDNARAIFDRAWHPKSFVALDGADHLLSDRRDAEYVATVVSARAARYLDIHDTPAPGTSAPRPQPLKAPQLRPSAPSG